MPNSIGFYEKIPAFTRFQDVMDPEHYRRVPDDWYVVITDVVGSTKAIAENRYKDVNMLGASSIVAILNAIDRRIPFVFGGDGATVLIHESDVEKVRPALAASKRLAREAFGLELRTGYVPVAALSREGAVVDVARFKVSETATLAMLRGGGLNLAEKWVKSQTSTPAVIIEETDDDDAADFKGLSCRWNPVPAKQGEMISLLVLALGSTAENGKIYRDVLTEIEMILGEEESHPVTLDKIDPSLRLRNLRAEIVLRGGVKYWWQAPLLALKILGSYLFVMVSYRLGVRYPFFDPQAYVASLAAGSDFRKFDDMLRMVRDCDPVKRRRLEEFLEGKRRLGQLVYGVHVSGKAMMTCLMFNLRDHVHFIDGADGGYALAARQLKDQLKALAQASGN